MNFEDCCNQFRHLGSVDKQKIKERYCLTDVGVRLFLNPTIRALAFHLNGSPLPDISTPKNQGDILRRLFLNQVYEEFLETFSFQDNGTKHSAQYKVAFRNFLLQTNYFDPSVQDHLVENCWKMGGHYNASTCIWDLLMKGYDKEREEEKQEESDKEE